MRLKSVKQVEKQLSVKQRKMLKIVPINVTVSELQLLTVRKFLGKFELGGTIYFGATQPLVIKHEKLKRIEIQIRMIS